MLIRNTSDLLFKVMILLVTCLLVVEQLTFRVSIINKLLFLLISILTLAIFIMQRRSNISYLKFIALIIFLAVLSLANIENATNIYFLTDSLLLITGLLLIKVCADGDKISVIENNILTVFVILLLLMFCVYILGISRINNRFPSMSPYIVTIFATILVKKNVSPFVISAFLIPAIALIFLSGDRTALIVTFASFLLLQLQLVVKEKNFLLKFCVVVFITVAAVFLLQKFISMLGDSRIGTLSDVESDYSAMQRIYEIRDVLFYVSENFYAGGWKWFFGFGPGATFFPVESWSPNNILDTGEVHHIHSTPFVLLYRFGMVGLTIWLVIMYAVLKSAIQEYKDNYLILSVVFCLVIDQLLRNVLVNPIFFIAASFVIYYGTKFRERKIVT